MSLDLEGTFVRAGSHCEDVFAKAGRLKDLYSVAWELPSFLFLWDPVMLKSG